MTGFRYILAFLTPALLLAGCGSDGDTSAKGKSANNCGSAFNPATTVFETFSDFTLTEPARLERTLFRDVLLGVQPADTEDTDSQAVADAVKSLTARFNGGKPDTGAGSYTSVRNPIDLVSLMIGEDRIENFSEGRRTISDCIDAGNAAEYSTSANGVLVTFEEVDNGSATDRYNYPTVRWVYAPEASDKVIRVTRFQGLAGEDLQGAVVGVQFNSQAFSSVGFNAPELVQASFTASNNQERLGLQQDFVDAHTDDWIRSSNNVFDFAGQTGIDCARVVVDYDMAQAEVFTSVCEDRPHPDAMDCSAQNAYKDSQGRDVKSREEYVGSNAYCGNASAGEGHTYSTQPVSARQQ
ncbi:hypothetical protein [Marinobacter fonticola]|uniref:hypothetical protein n=1 Tax=Marinobacter fonticola TaxID=2603215 RepID=UPI0011E86BFA|nr:hypothetical protein [Marinobacter fonticola]